MKLQEIETALSHFKVCPKCNSNEGFWLGMKGDYVNLQCKCCGVSFELVEAYTLGEKHKKPRRLKFFRNR